MKKGQPNAWQGSTQWRMISRDAIKRWNAKRETLPKCGAKRKRDGQPCQQLAKENGRCYFHGGRTGKGAEYHVRLFPNGAAPNAEAKLQRKLRQIERDRKALAKRIAQMSPQEKDRYDAWVRSHTPGPAAERARRRQDRKRAAELRAILEKPDDKPVTPELAELQRQVVELEAARDRYLKLAEMQNQNIGVFR